MEGKGGEREKRKVLHVILTKGERKRERGREDKGRDRQTDWRPEEMRESECVCVRVRVRVRE